MLFAKTYESEGIATSASLHRNDVVNQDGIATQHSSLMLFAKTYESEEIATSASLHRNDVVNQDGIAACDSFLVPLAMTGVENESTAKKRARNLRALFLIINFMSFVVE
jgi:hypothetical protein